MFSPEGRARLRAELLERASRDDRIAAAAITGSAAAENEDRWSDIDLAFGVADGASLTDVLRDWTAHVYGEHHAVHHLDVIAGSWTYRVFLLANTLQLDLAFVRSTEFRALASTFSLVFGEAGEPVHAAPPPAEYLVGFGWLHAVHARSALARGRYWQAEYMISGLRNQALALACIRHGLPAAHARGLDQLPQEVTVQFHETLVGSLEPAELRRAFRAAIRSLRVEIRLADSHLAARLEEPLNGLAE